MIVQAAVFTLWCACLWALVFPEKLTIDSKNKWVYVIFGE